MPLRTLITAVLATGLLAGCVVRIAEHNIVRPRPGAPVEAGTIAEGGWTVEPLAVETANGVLRGARFHRPGARATVLYFGGNGFVLAQHHSHVLKTYRDLPVDVIAFDHRGYGASTGTATLDALLADGVALFDRAHGLPDVAARPLVIHGHSLGSFVAGHVAEVRRLDALVLEATATTAEDWIGGFTGLPWYVRRVEPDRRLAGRGNAALMPVLDEPLLLVAGERDATTRPAMARALYDAAAVPAARKELLVVPGAGHMDATRQPAYAPAFLRLLDRAAAR
ncbi:alpha/beta hydrolase [Lysobacter humi (ex Lee et al. 2017)]